jgi:hypothetical protein
VYLFMRYFLFKCHFRFVESLCEVLSQLLLKGAIILSLFRFELCGKMLAVITFLKVHHTAADSLSQSRRWVEKNHGFVSFEPGF